MKLKLVHLKTYIMNGQVTVVKKGEIVHVTDAVGASMLRGGRHNADNEFTQYWQQVAEDTPANHDFRPPEAKAKAEQVKAAEPDLIKEEAPGPAIATEAPPPVQRSQRSRARAAA